MYAVKYTKQNFLPRYTWHSIAKFARLDDAFQEAFEREVRLVEGQSLQQKDKTKIKRKAQKITKKTKP